MSHFIVTDRKTDYLLPPSVDDWLNQDHLARFIVEVVEQLDLSKLTRQYAGGGSKAYHPATLQAILVYGYATGVFSSRKLERATYDSVAFRYIGAGSHPDHDSLASFRRRFLDELSEPFLQLLEMAKEMKLLKLGNVCLDGTKIEANASRHSALSHAHAGMWSMVSRRTRPERKAKASMPDASAHANSTARIIRNDVIHCLQVLLLKSTGHYPGAWKLTKGHSPRHPPAAYDTRYGVSRRNRRGSAPPVRPSA